MSAPAPRRSSRIRSPSEKARCSESITATSRNRRSKMNTTVATPPASTPPMTSRTTTPDESLAPCGHDISLTDERSERDIKCQACFDNREVYVRRLMRSFGVGTPPAEETMEREAGAREKVARVECGEDGLQDGRPGSEPPERGRTLEEEAAGAPTQAEKPKEQVEQVAKEAAPKEVQEVREKAATPGSTGSKAASGGFKGPLKAGKQMSIMSFFGKPKSESTDGGARAEEKPKDAAATVTEVPTSPVKRKPGRPRKSVSKSDPRDEERKAEDQLRKEARVAARDSPEPPTGLKRRRSSAALPPAKRKAAAVTPEVTARRAALRDRRNRENISYAESSSDEEWD